MALHDGGLTPVTAFPFTAEGSAPAPLRRFHERWGVLEKPDEEMAAVNAHNVRTGGTLVS